MSMTMRRMRGVVRRENASRFGSATPKLVGFRLGVSQLGGFDPLTGRLLQCFAGR